MDQKYQGPICNSFENYLNYIKDPENPEVLNCYFLGHLGLGDNITNSSAVNYLLQHYNTIYFFCKDISSKQAILSPCLFSTAETKLEAL